ncbi:YchJ family protein [Motiliproteus sp. MSK22-1]|uniref:YchJ family protein n=1 Tax=Motiliproteus sp. MSK22-1 TaxID=1897630 RepID=UPI0009757D42|nr:YchJ family protein [Motiliproteus sp. MSK22-1]OMH36280.1 zinc chelation protein SecC [Motiliproteus sp. MSK22-1]
MLHDQKNTALSCPCGSRKSYNRCCEPAIEGSSPAKTAEQLMRSRYTAFALGMSDYIVDTTHPDYRKDLNTEILDQQNSDTTWLQLTILTVESGSEQDDYGRVSFVAEFSADGQKAQLHENSRFSRINGLWYYLDGEVKVQPF